MINLGVILSPLKILLSPLFLTEHVSAAAIPAHLRSSGNYKRIPTIATLFPEQHGLSSSRYAAGELIVRGKLNSYTLFIWISDLEGLHNRSSISLWHAEIWESGCRGGKKEMRGKHNIIIYCSISSPFPSINLTANTQMWKLPQLLPTGMALSKY
jgi:hypothetical protein